MSTTGGWTITRRDFVVGTAATGAGTAIASSLGGCSTGASASKLAIIHTNDVHGHALLDEESLGYAAVAQLRADYEDRGYEVLLLDAGDAAQGDLLVNHSYGDVAIDLMNDCGYHAMALGNHEFDYGQDKIADYVAAATFPLLSANTLVDATGEPLVEQRVVLSLSDGTKVGVFGLTTPSTQTTSSPLRVQGLTFLEGEEMWSCAQEQANALRDEGCALVVCLAHLGEKDPAPNRTIDVVTNTTGIDLVIDGHDHLEEGRVEPNAEGGEVLLVETGCYTHAVGVVTWEDGVLSHELATYGSYEGQDEAIAASVQAISDDIDAEMSEVVATSDYLLDGERAPGVRTQETNLGDLVADAVFWEAQRMSDDEPDCIIMNGGGIRASIEPGEVSLGDVVNVLPYINYVCTIQVTGAQLLEALEASCFALPEQTGAFPQVSGMSIAIDAREPFQQGDIYPNSTFYAPASPGSRVTIRDVAGRGFSVDDSYTIASIDFLCSGGDSYHVFADAAQRTMKSINYLASDCLRYYLEEACGGVVPQDYADPAGQGRIEVIV